MFARKFAYEVMAAGPFIMLGAIGIHARTTVDGWTPIEYAPAQLENVRAYVVPVRTSSPASIKTPGGLRKAADAWLSANRKGLLKDVFPVAVGENAAETPRGEIIEAKMNVAFALQGRAHHMAAEGDVARACDMLADAFEIGAIGKYGSFESVVSSCSAQQSALEGLRDFAGSISADQRTALARRIASTPKPARPLDRIVAHLREGYTAQLRRNGDDGGSIEVTQVFGRLASLTDPDGSGKPGGEMLSAWANEQNTDLTYAAVTARRARISEEMLRREVDRTLALLR